MVMQRLVAHNWRIKMDDYRQKLMTATDLLQQCADGFGAFVNGRKMARNDRDKLRAEIAGFLDGAGGKVKARYQAPATEYGQCSACGIFSGSAKALHDAKRDCG